MTKRLHRALIGIKAAIPTTCSFKKGHGKAIPKFDSDWLKPIFVVCTEMHAMGKIKFHRIRSATEFSRLSVKQLFTGLLILLLGITTSWAQDSLPQVCCGKLQRIKNFPSQFVAARNIDVWLPDGYSSKEKYAVLYMQDGQMLFDAEAAWNKQAWDVDDVANGLLQDKLVQKFIVVGTWNGGIARHSEYFPQFPFEQLNSTERDSITEQLKRAGKTKGVFIPQSDNYLKFLVKELKPYIEANFSVYTDKAHCFLAGSSMGGLISLYGLCEYPEVFGGVACLSTHWTGSYTLKGNPMPDAFLSYLNKKVPDKASHKIYFDCGDQTLDSLYPGVQRRVDSLLLEKGFSSPNFMTRFFPGQAHEERAWSRRLATPLEFLFKK